MESHLIIFCAIYYLSSMNSVFSELIKIDDIPRTREEGEPLNLTCIISGPEFNTEYQWLKDSDVLVENGILVSNLNTSVYSANFETNQDGRRVFTLSISKVSRYDNGLYECGVSNDQNKRIHSTQQVNVNYQPDPQYPICSIEFGQSGRTLVCESQKGYPIANLEWVEISNGIEVKQKAGASMYPYSIIVQKRLHLWKLSIPEDLSGYYVTCRLMDQPNRNCNISSVDFYNATILTLEPSGQVSVRLGETVKFTCKSSQNLMSAEVRISIKPERSGLSQTSNSTYGTATLSEISAGMHGIEIKCVLQWQSFTDVMSTTAYLDVIDLPDTYPNTTKMTTPFAENTKKQIPSNSDKNRTQKPPAKSDRESKRGFTWLWVVFIVVILTIVLITSIICCFRKKDNGAV